MLKSSSSLPIADKMLEAWDFLGRLIIFQFAVVGFIPCGGLFLILDLLGIFKKITRPEEAFITDSIVIGMILEVITLAVIMMAMLASYLLLLFSVVVLAVT